MALFAGALTSFAQIASSVDPSTADKGSTSWGVWLVFLYAAILFSLAGSFLSLMVIKMCSDLPLAIRQRILFSPVPASGDLPEAEVLADHFRLLEAYGMSTKYKLVDRLAGFVLLAACVCTFTSLTFWIFLSETKATAGVTMVLFGLTAIIFLCAYMIGIAGRGWI
jgi:hypothetical protein